LCSALANCLTHSPKSLITFGCKKRRRFTLCGLGHARRAGQRLEPCLTLHGTHHGWYSRRLGPNATRATSFWCHKAERDLYSFFIRRTTCVFGLLERPVDAVLRGKVEAGAKGPREKGLTSVSFVDRWCF